MLSHLYNVALVSIETLLWLTEYPSLVVDVEQIVYVYSKAFNFIFFLVALKAHTIHDNEILCNLTNVCGRSFYSLSLQYFIVKSYTYLALINFKIISSC